MKRTYAYNRACPGPEIAEPFTVVEGLVVVVGQNDTITLPSGATWPGYAHLPEHLFQALMPDSSYMAPGSVFLAMPVTPREIEFGVSLITAQLLRTGPLRRRFALLGSLVDLEAQNQTVLGKMLGSTRETVIHLFSRQRQQEKASAAD